MSRNGWPLLPPPGSVGLALGPVWGTGRELVRLAGWCFLSGRHRDRPYSGAQEGHGALPADVGHRRGRGEDGAGMAVRGGLERVAMRGPRVYPVIPSSRGSVRGSEWGISEPISSLSSARISAKGTASIQFDKRSLPAQQNSWVNLRSAPLPGRMPVGCVCCGRSSWEVIRKKEGCCRAACQRFTDTLSTPDPPSIGSFYSGWDDLQPGANPAASS